MAQTNESTDVRNEPTESERAYPLTKLFDGAYLMDLLADSQAAIHINCVDLARIRGEELGTIAEELQGIRDNYNLNLHLSMAGQPCTKPQIEDTLADDVSGGEELEEEDNDVDPMALDGHGDPPNTDKHDDGGAGGAGAMLTDSNVPAVGA